MAGPDSMLRREKAGEKAKKAQKKLELIEYRVEGGDILILSGQHKGKTVRSLWPLGPVERDYITRHLWLRHDSQVNEILNSLCCR
jgi:hypothetical protein